MPAAPRPRAQPRFRLVARQAQRHPGRRHFCGGTPPPIPAGTPADTIHHPGGDLKKFSAGVTQGINPTRRQQLHAMKWTSGVTEPGSSGSGLFTLNAASGSYELRGTPSGGTSSCANPSGEDDTRASIGVPAHQGIFAPTTTMTMPVEYYNGFQTSISSPPIRSKSLAVTTACLWDGCVPAIASSRTTTPRSRRPAQPVCRRATPYGDTCFYSASAWSAPRCWRRPTVTGSRKAAAFYAQLADSGVCPGGSSRSIASPTRRRRRVAAIRAKSTARCAARGQPLAGAGGSPQPSRAPKTDPEDGPAPTALNYQGLGGNRRRDLNRRINFAHQGDVISRPGSLTASTASRFGAVLERTANTRYSGSVFTATGPPFTATPFDPRAVETVVAR